MFHTFKKNERGIQYSLNWVTRKKTTSSSADAVQSTIMIWPLPNFNGTGYIHNLLYLKSIADVLDTFQQIINGEGLEFDIHCCQRYFNQVVKRGRKHTKYEL
jgi:hypothetical protein